MKNNNIPKKGFAGLKENFKDDFISGFSVSLIALPLCLGIALASGIPPLAGIVTAIVGGILASRVSGTFMTISGPAAGLIVITLGAAEAMGGAGADSGFAGYPHALGAIVIGGLIMALFGVLKVGKLGDFFPSAVVHGMLAAIGIIIIVKQLFVALGVPSPKGELVEAIMEIPHAIMHLNPYVALVTLVSLAILIVHPMINNKYIKMIPAPMLVLLATIPLATFIGTDKLVMVNLDGGLLGGGGLQLPSFEKIGESAFWIAVVGFAMVSAIESLLSAKAVDALDPYKRKSNLDKDLIAMGAGSSLAAALGGLPMISEIVRSSANVNNGAKTQWANFFHGIFLLIYVLIGVSIIEMIPVAALAAMLVFTGYRLASPKEFKHVYEIGKAQLVIFVVTLVSVLLTDLLIGVAVGIIFKLVTHFIWGAQIANAFKIKTDIEEADNKVTIKPKGALIFSNYLSLKGLINKYPTIEDIYIDFSNVNIVDHSVMYNLNELEADLNKHNRNLFLINMQHLSAVSHHPLSTQLAQKDGIMFSSKNRNNRQEMMHRFATKNQFNYIPQQVKALNSWRAFDFAKSTRVASVKNRLTGFVDQSVINIADVKFVEGAQMTERTHNITIMIIKPELDDFPSFTLEKEQVFDKMVAGWKDINFDSHPQFSKFYYLKSNEEKQVRAFFTEEMLHFFEQHKGFHVESSGRQFIVYALDGLLGEGELLLLLEMATGFDKIIHKNHIKV